MTDTNENKPNSNAAPIKSGAALPPPETSSERWAKYGANVALTCVIVIFLAGIVVWGAERFDKRADMTITSSYSLKPQTLAVIDGLKQPVKLVSLYARLKPDDQNTKGQQDFAQPVADTLDEYRREGKNIEVEIIDPVADPIKLDAWLGEITRKYGGNVKGYRSFLEAFPKTLEQIKTLASDQAKQMETMGKTAKFKSDEQVEAVNVAYLTVRGFPAALEEIDQGVKEELEKKIPDYKGEVDTVRSVLDGFSRQVTKVKTALEQLRDDKTAPDEARDYAKNNIAQFDAMKKLADDELEKIKGLGELKLDEVRRKLTVDDENGNSGIRTIAVEGPNDIKLIDFKDAWTSGDATGMLASSSDGPPRLRFAGERQITAAILSLTEPKKKVVFARSGGPPLTAAANPFGGPQQAPFSEIADRLRSYNFDVLEKDLSGQWAMQAMQQQMPVTEPSDEDIKDAIWIVMDEAQQSQFGPMPPSPEVSKKLADHLAGPMYSGSDLSVDANDNRRVSTASHVFANSDVGQNLQVKGGKDWGIGSYKISSVDGGSAVLDRSPAPAKATSGTWEEGKASAMVLVGFQSGDMGDALKDWGIVAKPSYIAVHERIGEPGADAEDFIEQARRQPVVFVLNNYGESPVTTPLQSLDSAFAPLVPIDALGASGSSVTHILPLPQEPKSWGEGDISSLDPGHTPTFDPAKDLAAPIYGGAIAEKKDANGSVGRLVVIGASSFAANQLLDIPDLKLARSHIEVARFPGNGELFTNSIFWLAHMDRMIALSPAALDTARIEAISPAMLNFWRYGVLLIGLPLLAVCAGLMVWQTRKD